MSLETIEYVVFAFIIIAQIIFFYKTRNKIQEFDNSVAEISRIGIADLELSEEQVRNFSARGDIFNLTKQKTHDKRLDGVSNNEGDVRELEEYEEDQSFESSSLLKIKLVESSENDSIVFNNILNSLNKYLLRNRHSVADFTLIKDIVERNTGTIEDEVNLTLSTPLYLGLMGTMLGVVIGIFSMSSFIGADVNENTLALGIAILLGSVKIAMIASFVGLLLTIYNSAIIFKGSKFKLENKKNEFYTMIQVELLPSLNQGVGATFDSLQRNLFKFNEKFDLNLDRLNSVFDKNYDSILMQKQLIEQLDRSKIADITKYNLKILNEMSASLLQFEKFNSLFSNVNVYLSNSYKLADRSTELLDRTNNFEKIAETIESSLAENTKLTKFLSTHFSDLERHRARVDESITYISYNIKDTFEQLNKSLQESSLILAEEVVSRNLETKGIFDEFSNDLKQSLTDQTALISHMLQEKQSNLDHLKHLESLLEEVKSLKIENDSSELLVIQVQELNSGIIATNNTLKRIEHDAKKSFFQKIFTQK